jgi:hypothetical protein
MLWSPFSAIFANFLAKIGVFLKNLCYDQSFVETSGNLTQNANFLAIFLRRNILKVITPVPDLVTLLASSSFFRGRFL